MYLLLDEQDGSRLEAVKFISWLDPGCPMKQYERMTEGLGLTILPRNAPRDRRPRNKGEQGWSVRSNKVNSVYKL